MIKKHYFPVKRVSEELGIDLKVLYEYIKRGYIEHITIGGVIRISRDEIERIQREDEEYMTISNASKYFDVSEYQIRKLIRDGTVNPHYVRGIMRIDKTEAEKKFSKRNKNI